MLLITLFAFLAGPDGKTMASDDWHSLTITEVGAESAADAPLYVRVAAADLDGDGLDDSAMLRLTCADGALQQAAYAITPRDAASGQASGKRMHKPVTITKEWGPSTPQLRAVKPTYDVKTVKGARVAAPSDWQPITLSATDGLCAATQGAARAVKTRSNIQNN